MKSKHGAMEMSMGTIVTIVLLMSVLVLGIFFVQKIFSSSSNAIDSIDSQVQNEINKLFSEEGKKLSVYPGAQEVTIKKGDDPKGFAFSVKNKFLEQKTFNYLIESEPAYDFVEKCGSSMTKEKADNYLLLSASSFDLLPGSYKENAVKALFQVPEAAPPCTIPYRLTVDADGEAYASTTIYVTIK